MAETGVLHLGLTLGALEIGTLISSVFLGITTVQLYMYFKNGFRDVPWIRALVTTVWILETAHTIFVWVYLYNITVTNYGNRVALDGSPWTLSMSSVFNGILGGMVQAYFAYRVYVVSGSLIFPLLSWTGSALQLSLSIATAVLGSRMSFDEFAKHYQWMVTASLVTIMTVDFINTWGLGSFLWRERSKNRFQRTRMLVDKLIMWTLETALITSIGAFLMLVFFLGMQGTAVWISITIFYAKFYSNCLLASLNGRVSLRPYQSSTVTSSIDALEVNVTQDTVVAHIMADLPSSQVARHNNGATKGYDGGLDV